MSRSHAFAALLGLAACAHAQTPLRVEDRPGEGIVRVVNPGSGQVRFRYSFAPSFGDYQMFHVRYRDSTGRILTGGMGGREGWWTPLMMRSTAYPAGQVPSRELQLGPGAVRDFPRDALLASLSRSSGIAGPVRAPCAVQLKLIGSLNDRDGPPFEAVTGWQPAPCPERAHAAS